LMRIQRELDETKIIMASHVDQYLFHSVLWPFVMDDALMDSLFGWTDIHPDKTCVNNVTM
jgi:hypothetical protein